MQVGRHTLEGGHLLVSWLPPPLTLRPRIPCVHYMCTHATLSIPQTPAEATNASLLNCLPQSLYRRQEIVWLQTVFIACASLTAWSYKWPSRSRFWWACVHWGTDDAHHAGPGLDPCHEGRTHLWVNSAHPCPDKTKLHVPCHPSHVPPVRAASRLF